MRNLIDILDLSADEIDGLIRTAEDIRQNPGAYADSCRNKILATLFFEPSTRTRLSFESAMLSLGGRVLGFSDAGSSSSSKGESLADTIEVVSGYCDIIAMRHPKEGAPYVAADHSAVPVINAGDGGHYHPTQTLADLCTIHRVKGGFDGLTVGLCGDLKYGRTVHSLIGAMSRYTNVKFVLISPGELALPEFVKRRYITEKGINCIETQSLEDAVGQLDILYMTRVQRERFADSAQYERLKDVYVLTEEKMRRAKKDMAVMHPLPRVNEISVKVDADPRAYYFEQTRCGRFMRMALILKLLAEKDTRGQEKRDTFETQSKCPNPHCILSSERELKRLAYTSGGHTYCAYCDEKIN